ncbi:MAG: type II secretion system ATPase GspE [Alphaproteobacteria bacterium]|nr:type II secretion system ATPase GspE [Alphaproteobacteria bacterium]
MLQIPQDEQAVASELGTLLTDTGKLKPPDLERAVRLQSETHERINVILTKLGLVSESDMAEALGHYLGLPVVESGDYPSEPVLEGRVGARFLKEHRIIPLADTPDGIVLAMADPLDRYALDAVRLATDRAILPQVGVPADIEAVYERLYEKAAGDTEQVLDEAVGEDDDGTEADIERLKDIASEAPVIRLVNRLITKAVEMRASDIHIEPFERSLRVRYRIDGALRDMEMPPPRVRAAVTSRIKLLAKLNIAETRLPQDGRIRLATRGKEIDLRVSCVPTMHGESIVLRVLDRGSVSLDFAALGFEDYTLDTYLTVLDQPTGVLLVTGPTGSGKTTTLYTSLLRLNTGDRKILTVEDPVEYQLEGINQVQVKPKIGLSFANALRSLLRHDPDVIMIGEIRDLETAEIAVQAALTGHKVLSTLHTNDAASTVTRLLDMGVEDYLVTSTLNGIVAQRLVRALCPDCREPQPPLPELVDQLKLDAGSAMNFHKPVGCPSCTGTGYLGRTTIHEILVLTDEVRRLILRRAEAREIERAAVAEGMATMYRNGVAKAAAGLTTIEEVLRVTRDA